MLDLKDCKRNLNKAIPDLQRYLGNLFWSMFLFLWTVSFHLRFLCESDLRISCSGETHRNKHFSSWKNIDIFHIFGHNRKLPFFHWGSLEITLTVPLRLMNKIVLCAGNPSIVQVNVFEPEWRIFKGFQGFYETLYQVHSKWSVKNSNQNVTIYKRTDKIFPDFWWFRGRVLCL